MTSNSEEIQAIAHKPESPTFENTVVAMEKSGRLLDRVLSVFGAITSANTNPTLQQVQQVEAPKLAALQDAIYLNAELYHRVQAIYQQRATLHLDPESLHLVEYYHREFVHAGANLSDADKTQLKKINEEVSTLQNAFRSKLLAATREAAYATADKSKLAGLNDAQLATAARDASERKQAGWVLPLQKHHPAAIPYQPDRAQHAAGAIRKFLEPPLSAVERAIPAQPCSVWRICVRRRRNCSAIPTLPPGSWKTRWRKRRKRR